MRKITFFFFLIVVVFATSCNAQSSKYTTKSGKAISAYEKASKFYDVYNNVEAIKELDNAISADPNFVEAYLMKGDIYIDRKMYERAIEAYKKAIEIDAEFFTRVYINVAIAELNIGRYQDAKDHLISYQSLITKNTNVADVKKADFMKKLCEFGINAMKNPVPFNPINLGKGVNTKFNEYYPHITADDQTLLFTRDVYDSLNPKSHQEDFYISERKDTIWGNAYNIGVPVNTAKNEGAPTFSQDGRFIIFTACEINGEYGGERTGFGSCDLFYTQKNAKTWTKPINISRPVNSEVWETQPSISSDGKTLFFVRGPKGGKGNSDIFTSTRKDDGTWSDPVKLSDRINTPMREESVFIHPDNKTLYFSSEGHVGMGGFDLYMSKKDSLGNWGEPVNLGYPINTCGNETSLFINAMGDLAYFSSNREGSSGGLDIYAFELYEGVRPQSVTYLKGTVYDKLTKQLLAAKFELINLKTGKSVIVSTSDATTGQFLVCLPTDNDYALNVSKDGYLFYSENFTLSGAHSKVDPYNKDIPLQSIKIGETVVLKNIFFDTDKFELKSESSVELDKLTDLLAKNANMKIEISGHTDNVGDDKYNQVLSENRAKAVYEYLINHGIAKERLTYKGYGETKPIDTNNTDAGRANNRRTEFKVIG